MRSVSYGDRLCSVPRDASELSSIVAVRLAAGLPLFDNRKSRNMPVNSKAWQRLREAFFRCPRRQPLWHHPFCRASASASHPRRSWSGEMPDR
jgi:hypothetical protein